MNHQLEITFIMATRTLVAWVLVFVIDTPLKASVKVLVFMAAPNRERMALELLNKNKIL